MEQQHKSECDLSEITFQSNGAHATQDHPPSPFPIGPVVEDAPGHPQGPHCGLHPQLLRHPQHLLLPSRVGIWPLFRTQCRTVWCGIFATRSSGPYGPFLLAPVEGIRGPSGPHWGPFGPPPPHKIAYADD